MATKKATKCSTPGCRRKATSKVGRKPVCGTCLIPAAAAAKPRRGTVSIRAGSDKASQDSMTSLLVAMGAGGGKMPAREELPPEEEKELIRQGIDCVMRMLGAKKTRRRR